MINATETKRQVKFVDKQAMKLIVEETNRRVGFVKDPTATPQKARALMEAYGVRAEDNIGSCGILAAREE